MFLGPAFAAISLVFGSYIYLIIGRLGGQSLDVGKYIINIVFMSPKVRMRTVQSGGI